MKQASLFLTYSEFSYLCSQMGENLKERTAKGLFWGVLNNGTTQVLNILIGIFLGRLLSPEDYGIVGVLTIFTVIAGNLQSSGFTQGLVNIKSPTARDYNSVFWFNVLASVTIYVILFLSAPLIAYFFDDPRLVRVSRFVFLGFLISSFGIAHNAYMLKNMMNRELTIVGVIALVISGMTGIIMAFRGWAYWSLACQQIIYITVLNLGRYYYVPWQPQWKIDFGPVRRMFSFCVKILFTNIINTLSQHLLTFIFGRLFTIKDVGNYSQANNWNSKASLFVSGAIGQVAQPVLVEASTDRERQLRVYRKLLRFTAFLSFPLMLGLTLVGHEFILVTIGEKWLRSIPLLQILCIGGAFMPFYTLYQNLAISMHRSDIYLWCNLLQIVLQISIVLLFSRYGMTTMVIVYTLFLILWLVVWQWFARKLIGLRFRHAAKDVIPFLLITVFTMGVTWLLTYRISNDILLIVSRVLIAAVIYFVMLKLFHSAILDECIAFGRKKLGKG